MRKKARDLIYLNTQRYISLDSLIVFYWACILLPLVMVIFGIGAIKTYGVNWKSLFPLASIAIWSLLYWSFVLTVRSKRTKKTFELRFLVNGIAGLLISSLFWILYATLGLLEEIPGFDFHLALWILLFYVLFSVVYMMLIAFGVQNGSYQKIRQKSQAPRVIALDAFFASLIPISAVLGMLTSRWLRSHADDRVQDLLAAISLILLIFIPALAHINFVQYYYCKKYRILCDENGDATSPKLEPRIKVKQSKKEKENDSKESSENKKKSKKKIPLAIKILLGIIAAPIVFFIIVFLVFFVKAVIQEIF